eukprot:2009165-Rhodomonas_salina.1
MPALLLQAWSSRVWLRLSRSLRVCVRVRLRQGQYQRLRLRLRVRHSGVLCGEEERLGILAMAVRVFVQRIAYGSGCAGWGRGMRTEECAGHEEGGWKEGRDGERWLRGSAEWASGMERRRGRESYRGDREVVDGEKGNAQKQGGGG